mgnify:FL=1
MEVTTKPIILIPARLAATRFPNKPLAPMHGEPMITHVWKRAVETGIGPVIVAAGDQEIVDVICRAGGKALLTDPGLPSGSDRIHAALCEYDRDLKYDVVINVQGDLPTVDTKAIQTCLLPLANEEVDIATIGAVIKRKAEFSDPNVVKAIASVPKGKKVGRCLYFTRATAPAGDGPLIHHIGLYAYRRAALEQFVTLPSGVLEEREALEQLRALEAGLRIDIALVDTVPIGVDTPSDLDRAASLLQL